jgi:hypothetical protein
MGNEDGMLPMGDPDEMDGTEDTEETDETEVTRAGLPPVAPTMKERNSVQQEVNRLLDLLVPERAVHRMGIKTNAVEHHRLPRGGVLQGPEGAVTVSWFPDSAQGADLGELQAMGWKGRVSHPGSSQRHSGAKILEEMVLRPVEGRTGKLEWRAEDGTTFTTDALAARCLAMLERYMGSAGDAADED